MSIKKLVDKAKSVVAGRHSEGPGKDATSIMPHPAPPKDIEHIRADTQTHMNFKLEKNKSETYEEESKKIKENLRTPEAQKPHKFKPARWTFANGHPRCLICGDEERIGGCKGASKDDVDRRLKKSDSAEPKTKTPRQENSEATKNELASSEYANARKSKISNKGEDIARSARHKAMEWKGLAHAESTGEADKYVNLKNLLKYDPPNIMAEAPHNSIAALAAHHAIQKFPKQPAIPKAFEKYGDNDIVRTEYLVDGKRRFAHPGNLPPSSPSTEKIRDWTKEDYKKKAREDYVKLYNSFKNKAEELSRTSMDHKQVLSELQSHVNSHIKEVRGDESAYAGSGLGDQFVDFHNKGLSWSTWRPKHNSARHHVEGLLLALRQAKGESVTPEDIHNVVKQVIGGKSLTDAAGLEKKKKEVFDPAQFYTDEIFRVGPDRGWIGPDHHDSYLLNNAKLRGIQYGNSVTDKEREFHLKQTAHAMKDLTDILGLPDEMGSFNGKLGFAIGARGKAKALAHYEPDLKVINLTRKGGTGSLAHEFGHAFDHILTQVMHGQGHHGIFASDRYENSYYRNNDSAANPKMRGIADAMGKIVGHLQGPVRSRMMNEWRNGDYGGGLSHKSMVDYWMSTKELFARAFERYVDHKLDKNGRKNTYLTGVKPHGLWTTKEENDKLEPMFDELFNHFKNSEYLKKSMDYLKKR